MIPGCRDHAFSERQEPHWNGWFLMTAASLGAGVADDIYAAGLLVAYMAPMPFCQPGSIDGPTIQVDQAGVGENV
jgi:hypothetical protein